MEMMQKWAANRAFMGQLQRHEGQGTARMNIGCCCEIAFRINYISNNRFKMNIGCCCERVPICRYGWNRTARKNIGSYCVVVWKISSDF